MKYHQIKKPNIQSHAEMAARLWEMYLEALEADNQEAAQDFLSMHFEHVRKLSFNDKYIRED